MVTTLEKPPAEAQPRLRQLPGLLALPEGIYEPYRECAVLLDIKAKRGGRVPLRLNQMQRDYVTKKTYRNVIVKMRQGGMSTVELADNFFRTIMIPGQNMVIAAHQEPLAKSMLRQCKRWAEEMAPELRPVFGDVNNADEVHFSHTAGGSRLDSSIWVVSAKGRDPGRGRTVNILHGTEAGFWPDGGEIMAGVAGSVPDPPWGIITYESTPYGASGWFYQTYMDAAAAKAQGDREERFSPFFYAWWWDETRHDESFPKSFADNLHPDETRLIRLHGLTLGQLYWRRLQKRELERQGKYFAQEFPEDDQTCFLSSGHSVFPVDVVTTLGDKIRKAREYAVDAEEIFEVVKLCGQDLNCWVEPISGQSYVMGVDTSEGIGLDAQAAVVLNARTAEHVATLRSNRIQAAEFARKVNAVGLWYNKAYTAVERRSTGIAVLNELVRMRYPKLHYQVDPYSANVAEEPGWVTTGTSKPVLLSDFHEALSSGQFTTYSKNLVEEIRTYVHAQHGGSVKQEAAPGAHDDELMAAMIAYRVREDALRRSHEQAPPQRLAW